MIGAEPGKPHVSLLEVLCGIVAIAIPLVLALSILRYAVNAPYWDEFDWTPLILHAHAGTVTFDDLWAQHNDHRMFFGNLIAVGLASLGGWNQVRECFASLVVAVIGQIFVLALLRADFAPRTASVLLVLDSLLLFSFSQEGSWIWGFQTSWFLINTCVFGVLWALRTSPLSVFNFALAISFAFVASFSSLFGLNVWPTGLLALSLLHPLRLSMLAWIGFAVIATALYFYRYDFLLQGSSAAATHATPETSLVFFLVYLGSPLGNWAGIDLSATAGALGLVAYIALAVVALIRPRSEMMHKRAASWFALGVFAIFCGVLTTVGRSGSGTAFALESRYITPATMLWIGLLSLGVIWFSSVWERRVARIAAFASLTLGAATFVLTALHGLDRMDADYGIHVRAYCVERRAAAAPDDELTAAYPEPSRARSDLAALAAIGVGPEADSSADGGRSAPCR